jgi:phthiocerol/phenolphthiocerol synthesis type-I polyketide synthase E
MSDNNGSQEECFFEQIAVIGMAGSFPGAKSIGDFWKNIRGGVESIIQFTVDEAKNGGIPEDWLLNPNYVKVGTRIDHYDKFDADFFGYSPREALLMDPQQRLFLEKCWEAIESAGYDPERYKGLIGVFAGSSPNSYRDSILAADPTDPAGRMELMIASELDYLTTRVSYKLNLKGPSLAVQTACSTSLTAVQLACQSLLTYQCSIALAGGVSINLRRQWGYFYQEGAILSPDGRCRPFDASANGTVVGQGIGVVVLKRLSEAEADNDTIYAVIKGCAINNDGAVKIGFTAPSVEGQVEVIATAHALSGVATDTIGYIESHGTGTKLGDPIEVAALTQAFQLGTQRKGFCAIGSVKANIGHPDAASGIAGLIKTVLMLWHKEIPPSLHYETPNPQIDFSNSPFYVPTHLSKWKADGNARRAGVSSLGIGGTNLHAVLEEAPSAPPSGPSRSHQLIPLSARSASALEAATLNLARHIEEAPGLSLADAAYTLKVGRKNFKHRRAVVCRSREDAIFALKEPEKSVHYSETPQSGEAQIVFMFTGQGSQYAGMSKDLYRGESVFREVVDTCAEILLPALSIDIREILYPEDGVAAADAGRINQTALAQPALFVIEYALSKLWESWGVRPRAMVGHSIGEYVAACLAGVFDLESALAVGAARGRLMQEMPPGAMLAVAAPEAETERFLNDKLALAAVNAPGMCVVSGDFSDIGALEEQLDREKVLYKRLVTSHAFHSHMMETAAQRLAGEIGRYRLQPPRIPFLSNRSGTWITDEQATNPGYWAEHLRRTVRFSQCVETLLKEGNQVFLEVGPGNTLCTLAKQQPARPAGLAILTSLRHSKEDRSDVEYILMTLGRLWLSGVNPDWEGFYRNERRRRIPLPTYPFERKRFWPDLKDSDQQKRHVMIPGVSAGGAKIDSHFAETEETQAEVIIDSNFETEAEAGLAKIWRELLHMTDIGPADNYFELGGSSLLAARMFDQIEKRFKKRLPLATLYEAPTIRELADKIADKTFAPSWSSLVEINKGNSSKPPLFLMHSEGGNVLEYWPLARYLGDDQPVYAMQAKGLDGEEAVNMTIEEMAQHFITEMRAEQKAGPYYLGGFCLGGLVAYEMARQLIDKNEKVNFLTLISTRTPQNIKNSLSTASLPKKVLGTIGERVALELNNMSFLNFREKSGYVRDRIARLAHMTKLRCEKIADGIFHSAGLTMKWHSRDYILQKSVDYTNLAFFNYQPQPIKADIALFSVNKHPIYSIENETMGWSNLVKGNIKSYRIDCFHKNIMKEPNIRTVGERLHQLLLAAQNRAPN